MSGKHQTSKFKIGRGSLSGRYLHFSDHPDLRPTLTRVREAVFSMTAEYKHEMGFIDLCAGSGCMGLEAWSVGFRPVWLFDVNAQSVREIKQNAQDLSANVDAHRASAWHLERQGLPEGKWLIYADPPYKETLFHPRMLQDLAELNLIQPGSLYLAEHERDWVDQIPSGWQLMKHKKYGRAHIHQFEKIGPPNN